MDFLSRQEPIKIDKVFREAGIYANPTPRLALETVQYLQVLLDAAYSQQLIKDGDHQSRKVPSELPARLIQMHPSKCCIDLNNRGIRNQYF